MKSLRDPARAAAALAAAAAALVAAVAIAASLAGASPLKTTLATLATLVIAAAAGAVLARRLQRAQAQPLRRLLEDLQALTPNHWPERLHAADARDLSAHAAELHGALAALLAAAAARLRDADAARRRAEVLLNALDEPVLAVNSRGVLTMANDAAAAFFGVNRRAVEGKPVENVVTQAALLAALRAGLDGRGRTKRVELAAERGPRVMEVSVAPIPTHDGADHGAAMSLRDVTELALAARMKTEFVANASHELRTPLAAIRGAMDTVRTASEEDPQSVPRFLDMIASHLRRLEEMTADLLDLSRLETPSQQRRIEPLRVDELTSSLQAMFDSICRRRRIGIDFDIAPELDGVRTDPRMLHLALRNLISNAAKFCYENTTVEVEGRLLPPAPEPGADGPATSRARFQVRDHGVGIPLNQQQRVFERFYQVDPARLGGDAAERRGTGLGLAIVKHAVSALGGAVGLESVYGEGVDVWLEIPVEGRGPESGARPRAEAPSTSSPTSRDG